MGRGDREERWWWPIWRSSRLKAGCTVESPAQPVENTLGVATGRLPIGRRLATCPTILRRAFIPFGGPTAHEDSQDWLPHKAPSHLATGLAWWRSSLFSL